MGNKLILTISINIHTHIYQKSEVASRNIPKSQDKVNYMRELYTYMQHSDLNNENTKSFIFYKHPNNKPIVI